MFNATQVRPVLDLLKKYESRGDYDIVWGGLAARHQPPKQLTTMTVGEVMAWQDKIVADGAKSSAAGAYQIIRKTLQSAVAGTKISKTTKFNRDTQDQLGIWLLAQRGMQKYLDGGITLQTMAVNLAKEWASMPVPVDMKGASRQVKAGQSYYAGDGLNTAHATTFEVSSALRTAHMLYHDKSEAVVVKPTKPVETGWLVAWIKKLFGAKK